MKNLHFAFICLLCIFLLIYIINLLSKQALHSVEEYVEVTSIPLLYQYPELPTGCEATAAAMLLNWAGLDVTKEEVAHLLPKGSMPLQVGENLLGANPHNTFVGSPFSSEGYGVFHEPIFHLVNDYLPDLAVDLTGCNESDLITTLDTGRPVVAWTTIDMKKPKISKTWLDSLGNVVIWKTPEHAVLLVGYSAKRYIVLDPHTGKKEYYPRHKFNKIWIEMGRQAVTIKLNTLDFDSKEQ